MRLSNYLIEKSFTQSDIPRVFRVVLDVNRYKEEDQNDILRQLSKRELKGVSGISSSGEIIYNFLGVARDSILIMPAQATLELNKLSRFMYGNPHYFLSNNAIALARIWQHQKFDSNVLHKLFEYIFSAFVKNKVMSKYDVEYAAPYQSMAHYYKDHPKKIDGMKDLYAVFMKTLHGYADERMKSTELGGGNSWSNRYRDVLKDMSYKEFEKHVYTAFEMISRVYGDEGEWSVKDKILKIPEGSILYVLEVKYDEKNPFERDNREKWLKFKQDIVDTKIPVKFIDAKMWKKLQGTHLQKRWNQNI